MYHSSAVHRSPTEDEDRGGRDKRAGSNIQQLPPYTATSPSMAQYPSYSPTNGTHQQPPFSSFPPRPTSSAAMPIPHPISHSPRLGSAHSPTNGLSNINHATYTPRESGKSTYYDPTSEHRESNAGWPSPYSSRSPVQVSSAHQITKDIMMQNLTNNHLAS